MRVKNRLSPYPILNDYGDDYIGSSFSAEIEVEPRFSEVYGEVRFHLDDADIRALIDAKAARFVVHIECPVTCYRTAISTSEDVLGFRFPADQVANKIEVRTFIVMDREVAGLTSGAFHPDRRGQSFDFRRHQIIAIGSAKDYTVKKDDRDIGSLPSILRIIPLKDKKKGTMSVDTDSGEHITIGLSEDVFELYARLGKSTFRATAFSLVLLPALVIVLQRMYLMRDDESYTSMHWYQVIESILGEGRQPVETLDIQSDALLSVCQSIFADPISRSLRELDSYSEGMCE